MTSGGGGTAGTAGTWGTDSVAGPGSESLGDKTTPLFAGLLSLLAIAFTPFGFWVNV